MHIVALLSAVLVPVFMLLKYLGNDGQSENVWKLFERIDIVSLIFCVLAALLVAASLVAGQRRSLLLAAAALLFATFGLLLAFPLETPAQGDTTVKIGGYLTVLFALIGAGAAVFAAERVPVGGDAPVGAGRSADPAFTGPLTGGAPPAQPGWYADPQGLAKLRYHDGREWTQQTSN
jgi:prepilin signal peptidase PulO-like enzyme (type II secretory pathway)